ncbi:MAG TPA: hypothetical protein VHS99_27210 [Chloroflexota bacterium]|nr:hypothetical protein [Chloroflexota bacterium]
MIATAPSQAGLAMARLDTWLQSLRSTPATEQGGCAGYGGPVVHWWRDSMLFCGPGFDWRYEGIIHGYLTLFRRTGHQAWLERAVRAGDDLLAAQLETANFRHSGFELNPVGAGTPHEAAADIGLLALAAALKREAAAPAPSGLGAWRPYLAAAQRNLSQFYVGTLWDEVGRRFADDPGRTSFVPNKAATVVEALFLLADLTGDEVWIDRYALPTLDAILTHQVRRPGHPLHGGIVQNSLRGTVVEKYFPFYVARCVPALVAAAGWHAGQRYLEAAMAAGAFLLRWRDPDGAFPQVVYAQGRVNRYPRWVAGLGDILRAIELLRPHGLQLSSAELERSRQWLAGHQLPHGAIPPAEGFAAQVSQRPPAGPPDLRDLMPVAGWADKAFRYLAESADLPAAAPGSAAAEPVVLPCSVHGRAATYREDATTVEVILDGAVYYRWLKGETWATAEPEERLAR